MGAGKRGESQTELSSYYQPSALSQICPFNRKMKNLREHLCEKNVLWKRRNSGRTWTLKGCVIQETGILRNSVVNTLVKWQEVLFPQKIFGYGDGVCGNKHGSIWAMNWNATSWPFHRFLVMAVDMRPGRFHSSRPLHHQCGPCRRDGAWDGARRWADSQIGQTVVPFV